MEKIIYESLDIEESEFDNNYVIHSNAIRYKKYIFSESHSVPNTVKLDLSPESISKAINLQRKMDMKFNYHKLHVTNIQSNDDLILPDSLTFHPNEIIVSEQIILEQGFFAYNYNELLNVLSKYGKYLYTSFDKNVSEYLNQKIDILHYKLSRQPICIKKDVIKILIKFCNEFGFPFNTKSSFLADYEIMSNVLPQLLLIYLVNAVYTTISFLDSSASLDYDEEFLTSKSDYLTELKNTLKMPISDFDKKVFDEKTEIKLKFELTDYKIALLKAINTYSIFFHEPKKLAFSDYETNSFIYFSDNLLDLAWFSCINQITSNFKKGKRKKCKCGNEFIARNNQIRCPSCMKKHDSRKNTQQNKKNIILDILEISKNYIFTDTSIVLKLLEFKELKATGKIENIEEHKNKIKEIKKLKSNIQLEIELGNYTLK